MKSNVLYYGDNLDILRHHIPDGSVGLIYLDPPFKSQMGACGTSFSSSIIPAY